MIPKSSAVTIFEGPDGSGKTTLAKKYALATRAKYIHFPALKHVHSGLARMYVEAMTPALLGYQDVVLDRCWLSELPYGQAYRGGDLRLTKADNLVLERLAMRCGAVVVKCDPGWEKIASSFTRRKEEEMLDDLDQLRTVHKLYRSQYTSLPQVPYSYWRDEHNDIFDTITDLRMPLHPLALASAGNGHARVVIVGESFAERKDRDPWYQWPFGSFGANGCSQWLTRQLFDNGIAESQLMWINADQDLELIYDKLTGQDQVIALGKVAASRLYDLKIMGHAVEHPQSWKRFKHGDQYPLIPLLKDFLK